MISFKEWSVLRSDISFKEQNHAHELIKCLWRDPQITLNRQPDASCVDSLALIGRPSWNLQWNRWSRLCHCCWNHLVSRWSARWLDRVDCAACRLIGCLVCVLQGLGRLTDDAVVNDQYQFYPWRSMPIGEIWESHFMCNLESVGLTWHVTVYENQAKEMREHPGNATSPTLGLDRPILVRGWIQHSESHSTIQ